MTNQRRPESFITNIESQIMQGDKNAMIEAEILVEQQDTKREDLPVSVTFSIKDWNEIISCINFKNNKDKAKQSLDIMIESFEKNIEKFKRGGPLTHSEDASENFRATVKEMNDWLNSEINYFEKQRDRLKKIKSELD